jgi:hypothetical protein
LASKCNVLYRYTEAKSNANRLTLRQWCRLCDSAELLSKRCNAVGLCTPLEPEMCFPGFSRFAFSNSTCTAYDAAAAAVIFARCRRGGAEEDLSLEQFVSALACVAAEMNKSFEAAVSQVGTCPLLTGGGSDNAAPDSPGGGSGGGGVGGGGGHANGAASFKTPGRWSNTNLRPKTSGPGGACTS